VDTSWPCGAVVFLFVLFPVGFYVLLTLTASESTAAPSRSTVTIHRVTIT